MGNKKISLKDKALIKKRLAMGDSLRIAIKGTGIKSPQTAKKIADESMDEIGQIRENYLKLIESFNAHDIDRAKLWAEMTKATKLHGKNGVEHPDWRSRAEALKYLDSLAGIKEGKETIKVNILNNPAFLKQYEHHKPGTFGRKKRHLSFDNT